MSKIIENYEYKLVDLHTYKLFINPDSIKIVTFLDGISLDKKTNQEIVTGIDIY